MSPKKRKKARDQMKIEDKRDLRVEFGNLKEGDVFADGTTKYILMKITESEVDGDIANAIDLADGEFFCYSDKATVSKLNVKVVIE